MEANPPVKIRKAMPPLKMNLIGLEHQQNYKMSAEPLIIPNTAQQDIVS